MGEKYVWKNKPRILTYTNPREINQNQELMKIISTYPHLCASDTLLMGLIHKYSRSKFTFLTTVESFIENLFDRVINNKEIDLQMFVDVTKSIENMKESEDVNVYKSMLNNRGSLVEAFKMLTLLQYDWLKETDREEQNIFLKYIYTPNADVYINEYKKKVQEVSIEKCRIAFQKCLLNDICYYTKIEETDWKVVKEKVYNLASQGNREGELYKNIIDSFNDYSVDTVVLHGIARFTPEIMMMIRALDSVGIKIIFLINYADNLPGIYNFWEKVYEWVGVDFEYVDTLALENGHIVGRNIAKICNGIRPSEKANAQIVKYSTITDFTDGAVRPEFMNAERKAKEKDTKNVLANMRTQYYAVSAERPNDILRNYFPEQFIDKPFLAYPIGQFIKALFLMWDFEKMELAVDFNVMKESAVVKIGHNNDKMIQTIDRLKLYFKDMSSIQDIDVRVSELISNIDSFNEKERRIFNYLSYFSVSLDDIKALQDYIHELDNISRAIFGYDKEKQYDYRSKFKELISIVQNNAATENALSQKENELILTLIKSLSVSAENHVVGSVRELRDALNFFLSIKKDTSSANWIVRGFDQIDGAPLMKMPAGRIYEFSMMSMKNMTKTTRDILPWPLDVNLFNEHVGYSIFLEQMKNIVELRNEYLRFYFFYGAFFSKGAQIKFSYVENDHEERQRAYYLLDLLNIPITTNKEKSSATKYEVTDSEDSFGIMDNDITVRDRELFSICPYKYFLTCVLKNNLYYSSEYHTNYFLENEIVNLVEIDCNYDKRNINSSLPKIMKYVRGICPYIDEAIISDMEKFVRKNFSNKKREEFYLRRKRDFLIAAWKNLEKNEDYMKYNKTAVDIERYMRAKYLAPTATERPHAKVCEECNYNEICLNYYLDKEVDE